ncbi:Phage Mu protein F like protein [compost metagenome]
MGEAFSKWIEETIGDERATRAPNLKAVVRTNLNDAYNQGLRTSYEAPENRGFVTALMYSSVLDHRTTPFCRAWDGVIRKIDDPIWKRVSPPNHYGERAVLLPLTRDDSFELTKDLPTIKPQTGF